MNQPKSPLLPAATVALAALWILVGAAFKLLMGTPADLPSIVRELPPWDVGLTYKLAIAIELVVAVAAIVRPKLFWIPVALMYAVFGYVLSTQIAEGLESCGCLGSKVELTPQAMAWIDGVLVVLMFASRPWRITKRGLKLAILAPVAALLVALPWLLDRQVTALPSEDDGASAGPQYASLPIEDWVGQSIYETPLAALIEEDVYGLPGDGVWVLYRWQCDHCAEHLEEMVREPPDALFVVLVRLREKLDSAENQSVFFMPEGEHVFHANMPDTVEYVITTPGELWVENGIIVSATEGG